MALPGEATPGHQQEYPTLPNSGDPVADAKELGRGLMRGHRPSLKQGYTWQNALIAARDRHDLTTEQTHEVGMYLRGYAAGINNEGDEAGLLGFYAGMQAGQDDEESGELMPG